MKSEKAVVMGFVFVLAMLTFVGSASAATHHVNPGESIQVAVNAASDGDTIIVCDGTYTENVNVNKRLTIRSENGSAIIHAENSSVHVFEVNADYVIISGFTAEGAGYRKAGIGLGSVKHCNISNNNVMNNYYGIYLYSSSNNIITNNNVNSNGIFGIQMSCSNNNYIMNNNASDNGHEGIHLWESSNNSI